MHEPAPNSEQLSGSANRLDQCSPPLETARPQFINLPAIANRQRAAISQHKFNPATITEFPQP